MRAARSDGANVTCEAAPHHFTLDERAVLRWGPNAKMRRRCAGAHDVEALRAGLADGTIDMIATDHAPHDPASKRIERLAGCFSAGRSDGERLPESDGRNADAPRPTASSGSKRRSGLALDWSIEAIIAPARWSK